MNETVELATFAATCRDVPEDVLHEAKRCLIDWTGVGIAGSVVVPGRPMHGALQALAPDGGGSPIFAASDATLPHLAALANGFFSHVHDFDDTFAPPETAVHASAAVWPVVFALGGQGGPRTISGRDALRAFVVGYEVACRLGLAAGPEHYERGWHVTGTAGHVGAGVAGAHVFGFDPQRTTATLGTAATQSAGIKEVYGSSGKPFHPGKAASDGVLATTLVDHGFTSTSTTLEGDKGFLHLFSDGGSPSELVAGLGETWTIRRNSFKPYACGQLMHPTIEAIVHLCRTHDLAPEAITAVHLRVHPYVLFSTGKRTPASGLEGKFSIYHAASVAVLDRQGSTDQFTDLRVNAEEVVAYRDRVSVTEDNALDRHAAHVRLDLRDGSSVEHEVHAARGTPGSPMTDLDIEEKYRLLVEPVLGERTADEYLARCWALEEEPELALLQRWWS